MTSRFSKKPLKLALLCDYKEEGWRSMDRAGAGLASGLKVIPSAFTSSVLRPKFVTSFGRLAAAAFPGLRNFDRGVNRYLRYPQFLNEKIPRYDAFHIVDHSYCHLANALPKEKFGVFVHDIDAFRAALPIETKKYSLPHQLLAKYLLSSLKLAPLLFTSTQETAKTLQSIPGLKNKKILVAPYGCDPEFFHVQQNTPLVIPKRHPNYLLHVGSCIPRKQIDWLLEIYHQVQSAFPGIELIQVGGTWTADQKRLVEKYQLSKKVHQYSHVSNEDLATWYRYSKALLLPSSYEGFGFPILESLASGRPVFASDLPTVRELGGNAVTYCKVGKISEWSEKLVQFLNGNLPGPESRIRIARAKEFTWEKHAKIISEAYETLLNHSHSNRRKVA